MHKRRKNNANIILLSNASKDRNKYQVSNIAIYIGYN